MVSLLVRPTAPSLVLGLVVAASLIVAESLLGYLLGQVAPEDTLGVVYLLGVVVIAMGWAFWLAAATSVASALASGLIGLIDRVEALGGTMAVSSHSGSGTSLLVEIPIDSE
jgi:membrane-bound acyltransferase YfiQ involved in biofilm formation